MTYTTFKINNTSNNNTFRKANYSKILDNIIATNIAKCNPYLTNFKNNDDDLITAIIDDSKKKHCSIFSSCILKDDDEFIKAANFLANYKKKSKAPKNLPFIFGKTYKLIDGTPICFYEDEIQIDMDLYSYDDFSSIKFLKGLSSNKKNIIINIYNAGNITININ